MADKHSSNKTTPSNSGRIKGDVDYDDNTKVNADQAEGERNRTTSTKVGRTPDQAEGDRETVEEDLEKREGR